MRDDIAISVNGVGKQFRIGAYEEEAESILASIANTIRRPISNYKKYRSLYKFDDANGSADDVLWALRDVNFEVPRGQVMGIVGMNGAGKSTLLKILAGITPPSEGRIEIRGRVSSLLEVGTGFHPELTGRENVYLNGTMMGMTKIEVDQKFDEIIDFSGVEKFLDTPVKRYSSGMRVRLAFAVAAHLEPEILIVDEVLAVGDAAFQRKCLDKMEDAGQDGRTVLFVSHNLPAVARLCSRAILLKGGTIIADGTANDIVTQYLANEQNLQATKCWTPDEAPGDESAQLRSMRIKNEQDEAMDVVEIREPIGLEMEFDVFDPGRIMMVSFTVFDDQGNQVFITVDTDETWQGRPRPAGTYKATAWIPGNLMGEGTFNIGAHLSTMDPLTMHFNAHQAISVQVIDNLGPGSARGNYIGAFPGAVRPKLNWETQFNTNDMDEVASGS